MNRTYLSIIVILILAIIGVSSYAFYKANSAQNPPIIETSPRKETTVKPTPTQTAPEPTAESKPVLTSETSLPLSITYPVNGALVSKNSLVLTGKTTPKAEVVVNSLEVKANSTGAFAAEIFLDEGENYIYVAATNEDGDFAEQEIQIIYEPNQ